jgi:hypothetical protein
MRNIGSFSYSTYLKYQASTDGINWSAWVDAGSMIKDAANGLNYLSFNIVNPYTLNIGKNKIYIRTACYNYDPAIAEDKQEEFERTPGSSLLSEASEIFIELDKSPAEYGIAYASINRTRENVSATLTINNPTGKKYTVTSQNSNIEVQKITDEEFKLTISDNVNAAPKALKIEDNLGNITEAGVVVDWIDKVAPAAVLKGNQTIESGTRKDAELIVGIDAVMSGTTQFALMDHDGEPAAADFDRFNKYKAEEKISIAACAVL